MKFTIAIFLLFPLFFSAAQNIATKRIPGMSHYEHTFKNEHRLGSISEEKYPHVHLYCRSNDSALIIFKLIIERKGTVPVGGDGTVPVLIYDGDVFKSNSASYEQFPLNDGVLETFEFYAPSLIIESLANSDEVVLDIGGATYDYPSDLRSDYNNLLEIVSNRDKASLISESDKAE